MTYSSNAKNRYRVYAKTNGNKRFIFIKEFKSERAAENYTIKSSAKPLVRRVIERSFPQRRAFASSIKN